MLNCTNIPRLLTSLCSLYMNFGTRLLQCILDVTLELGFKEHPIIIKPSTKGAFELVLVLRRIGGIFGGDRTVGGEGELVDM